MSSIEIDGRKVGEGYSPFLIAEVAQAHDGSLGAVHSYIDLVADLGADSIKFQTHIAEAETTPLEDWRVKFSYQDATRYAYWKRMEFSKEQWSGIFDHCRMRGLIPLSSAFSIEACELLHALGMGAWKVASGEVTNTPMLEWIAKTQRPMLLSSGMSDFAEISSLVTVLNQRQVPIGIFQCTSSYPTPPSEVGLNVLDDYRNKFDVPVGLSDHSGEPFASIAAMARGASMIEAHICFHKKQFGPDTIASLDPSGFELLVKARNAIFGMLSAPVNKFSTSVQSENMRVLFTKSLAVRRTAKAGEVLTRDLLTVKKPGTGIPASEFEEYLGKPLIRDVAVDQLLTRDDVSQS